MKFLRWLSVLLVSCGLFADNAVAATKPNVILILADDLGFETIGANGGTSYRTPVLDKLASTGARFTHCYVQPLCTPTRVQLMTGQYNVRNYLTFGNMDPQAVTFGNLFKQAGFVTGIAGSGSSGAIWNCRRSMASTSIVCGSTRAGRRVTRIPASRSTAWKRTTRTANTAPTW